MAKAKPAIDKDAAKWRHLVKMAEKDQEKWEKRGDRILKLYRDDRDNEQNSAPKSKRMNILWSNVQTLKPSLYGREPIPIAERRYLDKDDVGKVASMILERAMRYEMGNCDFHETAGKCVHDYLLPGRGVAWLRFNPIFGPSTSLTDRGDDELPDEGVASGVSPDDKPPMSGGGEAEPDQAEDEAKVSAQGPESNNSTDELGQQDEMLLDASITVDYVNWKDFLHSKARTWDEVEWVCRKVYMSRDDLEGRFGQEIGSKVPLDRDASGSADDQTNNRRIITVGKDELKKATVYEIWCKYDRKVYFVAKMYDALLADPADDPLNLEGFWPCPKPLFATMTNDTLTPVPDYAEYQDQAQEIDKLTQRIDALLAALRVRGVYDSANKQLARLLDEGQDNVMIPVPNWAITAEKGGLQNAVSFLPLKDISEVLMQLFESRDKIKQDLYEITGISDIIRGQSDPDETAAAQKIKGRFATMRLQDRQNEVARFCRDIVRMLGEIISEHFPDQMLVTASGIMYDDGAGPSMPEAPSMEAPKPPQIPQPGMNPQQAQQLQQAAQQYQQQMAAYQQTIKDYQQKVQQVTQERQQLIQQAIQLLRQEKLRGFRIDIETDSTIADSANTEKEARMEFLNASSNFLRKSMEAAQMYPQMVPLLGKMVMFGIRGFRTGRDLESSFEEFIDQAEKDVKASAGQPKPPSPEMIKAQTERDKGQAEIAKAQIEAKSEQTNAEINAAVKVREAQASQAEHDAHMQQLAWDRAFAERQHNHRMDELEVKKEIAQISARKQKQALNGAAANAA